MLPAAFVDADKGLRWEAVVVADSMVCRRARFLFLSVAFRFHVRRLLWRQGGRVSHSSRPLKTRFEMYDAGHRQGCADNIVGHAILREHCLCYRL